MLSYCANYKKKTFLKTKNDRLLEQSKCAVCGIKKSKFVKKQKANGLLSSLGIKTPLSKISLLGDIFVLSIKWMK